MIRIRARKAGAFALALATLFAATAAGPASAETTRERILREGKIVIGIHNRSPWGFRDPATGEPTGWHPDLLRAAFSDLGVNRIELRVTEFGALIPGLLASRFDAVASGLAITPKRCKQVAFGDPDLKVPDAAIVLSGNPKGIHGFGDVAGNEDVIMGVGRGSVSARNARNAGVPDERMLLFPDIEANISALRAGRTDVAVLSSPTVIGLLAGGKTAGIERADPFKVGDDQANYAAIAFRKEDGDLRDLYDQRLARLKADGTITTIMHEYGFGQPEAVSDSVTVDGLCGGADAAKAR